MGVVVRQSLKSAIVTLIGVFLGVASTFLSLHYFKQIEYGFTNNLILITAQASFLGLFGFNYAVLIQGQKYGPESPFRGAFLTFSSLVPGIFTLIVALLLFLFKGVLISFYKPEDQEMMTRFYLAIPALAILTIVNNWLSSYLMSIQKNAIQSFGMEIIYRVLYIGVILFYAWGLLTYGQFVYVYLITWIIPTLYFFKVARKNKGFVFNTKLKLPKRELKEILRFSAYHSMIIITTVLIFQVSSILVGTTLSKRGLVASGIYSAAYFALSLIRNPTRVIANTVIPTFTRHYLDADLRGLRNLYHRSCINMQILALAAIGFIVLNASFIDYMIGLIHQGYEDVIKLILILVLGQAVDMICGFNYQIISISKYYRFNLYISAFLLAIVIGLSYLLIPRYDVYGAAWATTLGLFVFNLIKVTFVWSKFKMEPFIKESLWVFLIVICAFGIAWIIPTTGSRYIDLILKNSVLFGLILALLLKFKVSEEISNIIRNLIEKKRPF